MDLLELLDYVEKNPNDYEKRWMLAKKLYQNKDYHLALEHLTVLKNEWEPKVNVVRFYAATLYRLGKYDEAIKELQKAIEQWSDEPGLYEQLGKVYVTTENYREAKKVYEKLMTICPDHRWAHLAVDKLRRVIEKKTVRRKPMPVIVATDFDLLPESICKRCGADNPRDASHCWKCKEPLKPSSTYSPVPNLESPQGLFIVLTPEIITLIMSFVLIISLVINIILSVQTWLRREEILSTVPLSFWEIYQTTLVFTRIISGFILIAISPLIIRVGLKIVGIKERIPSNLILFVGALVPSILFLCSWLPKPLVIASFVLTPLIAFLIIFGTFGITIPKSLNLTIFHWFVLILSIMIIFTVVESYRLNTFINPFTQIPAVIRFFQEHKNKSPHSLEYTSEMGLPLEWKISLVSSGSLWLDLTGRSVKLKLFLDTPDEFTLELNRGETNPIIYDKLKAQLWETQCKLQPEETYTLRVQTSNKTKYKLAIDSLLILRML